jgi:hypothetical protein
MAFNNLAGNLQNRNVPIHSGVIVPKEELVHIPILSKRISKKKIEELAIQKYRGCGYISLDFAIFITSKSSVIFSCDSSILTILSLSSWISFS